MKATIPKSPRSRNGFEIRSGLASAPDPHTCPRPAPNDASVWTLWQLVDSAFPTGGFAHSGGLEAARQHGAIRSAGDLAGYLESSLHQAGHATLPFVTEAHMRPDDLTELDRLCDVFTTNHVANRASRAQGRAFLACALKTFQQPTGETSLNPVLARLQQPPPPFAHYAPVFGAVTRLLGVGVPSAQQLFLFIHLRGLVSAAVRLNIVGPLEGQSLQHRMTGCLDAVLESCGHLGVDDLAQTAPLHDLWQGAQDRLYSRLFQS